MEKKRLKFNKETDRKVRHRISLREYKRRHRMALIELLGGKCVRCGFGDVRALQIDHVNGDGYKERKYSTRFLGNIMMESIEKNEGRYQLLCANCNWIKRFVNSEHMQTL